MTFHTSLPRVVAARLPILPFLFAVSLVMGYLTGAKFPYLTLNDIAVVAIVWIGITLYAVIRAASSVTFEGEDIIVKTLFSEKRIPIRDFAEATFAKHVIVATPKGRPFASIPKVGFSEPDWQNIVAGLQKAA